MTFLDENFLLTTTAAREMFAAAKEEPIFDWHCHLPPREIYENKTPEDIAQLWLGGDHYKWRAMRSCGVSEALITGDAAGREKFKAWAACMPKLIGNPLYHWAHLELQRFFGCHDVLNETTAQAIWDECNMLIGGGGFTPRELIERSDVRALCTTDDPADSLEYHQALAKEEMSFRVLPAFRPDKALSIEQPGFLPWLTQLEQAAGQPVRSFHDLRLALAERAAFFDSLGCRASDHGFPYVPYVPADELELERIFHARLRGEIPNDMQADQYRTALLQALAAEYARLGWAMELHLGPMRSNNTRMLRSIGPDTGFDSIGDWPVALPLSRFLDFLDEKRLLPKTILFNLNPRDNYVLGTMIGNFQGSEVAGKLQFGPAWWFLDNIDGMRGQLKALGNLGALGTFLGMVTDSRSFLSYPRHEYFRRIFCGLAGEWVEQGLYPDDKETLAALARDVSYRNAERYFGI
ncbi:MAG: glucuronate isomerase [Oscillospiraceae bacterium]|nr:glucuronate isomerase [Oscillospiraceae bacterium]